MELQCQNYNTYITFAVISYYGFVTSLPLFFFSEWLYLDILLWNGKLHGKPSDIRCLPCLQKATQVCVFKVKTLYAASYNLCKLIYYDLKASEIFSDNKSDSNVIKIMPGDMSCIFHSFYSFHHTNLLVFYIILHYFNFYFISLFSNGFILFLHIGLDSWHGVACPA